MGLGSRDHIRRLSGIFTPKPFKGGNSDQVRHVQAASHSSSPNNKNSNFEENAPTKSHDYNENFDINSAVRWHKYSNI